MDHSQSSQGSHSRRSLHRKQPSLSHYQTTPITKHYLLNDQILAAFESNYEQKIYQVAYALGLQFVETALLEIPKHGYFYSRRHERERMQSALNAVRVAQLLQELQDNDVLNNLNKTKSTAGHKQISSSGGEDGLRESDRVRVKRLTILALQQVEQASNDQQYESSRAATEADLRELAAADGEWVVCEPLLAFGDSLTGMMMCPEENKGSPGVVSLPPPHQRVSSGSKEEAVEDEDTFFDAISLDHFHALSRTAQLQRVQTAPAWQPPEWTSETRDVGRSSLIRDSLGSSVTSLEARIPPGLLGYVPSRDNSMSSSGGISSLDTRRPGLLNDDRSSASFRVPSRGSTTSQDARIPPGFLAGSYWPSRDNSIASSNRLSSRRLSLLSEDEISKIYAAEMIPFTRVASTESQLERALFLSGLEISTKVFDDDGHQQDAQDQTLAVRPIPGKDSPVASDRLKLSTLCALYREDFVSFCSTGRIRISYANTYQGRITDSTNGCTVIAPLMCIHHLLDHQIPDPGLTDATVKQVIDTETPEILMQLRRELGLSDQAFLIPSDAHGYLIQNGQLSQQQFVNVTGGNILDEGHLFSFVNTLDTHQESNKKLAATLFFHEHVVSVLQVRRERGTLWYDVIDSLPLKKTMMRPDETEEEFHRRLGLSVDPEEMDDAFLPRTSRVRCMNKEALTAFLRWYACSKFNDENTAYIDHYEWDETACDFDPRVFQAFVWTEAPQ